MNPRPTSSFASIASLVIATLTPMLAAADGSDGWATTFDSINLQGALPSEVRGVLVVSGGTESEARAAASALVSGFRATGLQMVLDGSALGDVAGLADSQIVSRALAQPVDAVAVVRVTSGPSGEMNQASVAIYHSDGTPLGSLSGLRGESPKVRSAPSVPRTSIPTEQSAAQRKYEASFLEIQDQVVSDDDGVSVVDVPVQGRSRHVLQIAEFLDLVGRHDLAVDMQATQRRHLIVAVSGGLIYAVGMGVGLWLILSSGSQASQTEESCSTSVCIAQAQQQRNTGLYEGVGIILVGAAAMAAGVIYAVSGSPPVSLDQQKQLAKDYNQRLRRSLGLPDEPDDTPVRLPPSSRPTLSLEPMLFAGGGGLGVHGTF